MNGTVSRRSFLKTAALSSAILASPLAVLAGSNSKRPNILVVLVDDMGYGHIGTNYETYTDINLNQDLLERDRDVYTIQTALEAAESSMPTLKKLTSEGVRFTDAHVANSLCAPSRSAILTGRYPQRMGIYNNKDINNYGIPKEIPLLPEYFQKNGYATAAIGKWHVAKYNDAKDGSSPKGQHPNDRGFDYYFGFNHSGTPYYDSEILYRNREHAKPIGFLTDQFTAEATDFIKKTDGKPFFVYLAYNCPHGPLNRLAPEKYDQKYKHLPKKLRIFNSYMYAVDAGIKQILETLKEKGEYDNTLIFFFSDNGASGSTPIPSNGPNRGFKGTLYQGGSRSGMMAWWPGVLNGGSVSNQLISSMDILPTALAACGISVPVELQLDGKNLLPLLKGDSDNQVHKYLVWANRNSLNWSYPNKKNRNVPAVWSIRQDEWILHYSAEDNSYALYNLEKDIGEKNNVSDQFPQMVQQLKSNYSEWFKNVKEPLNWDREVWLGLKPVEERTEDEQRIVEQTVQSLTEKNKSTKRNRRSKR